MENKIEEFLRESNAIEGVFDEDSFQQAVGAWEYLIAQPTLTMGTVLRVHKILMLHQPDLLPNEKGYLRQIPIYVGTRVGMNWKLLPTAMANWLKKMNEDLPDVDDKYSEMTTKELHVEFEKIHPFVDGNGRTGRMFMNWWRLRNGLPLLIIKDSEKQEYYKWFH